MISATVNNFRKRNNEELEIETQSNDMLIYFVYNYISKVINIINLNTNQANVLKLNFKTEFYYNQYYYYFPTFIIFII